RNEQMATGNRLLRATTFNRRGHCRASMRYIDNFHTAQDADAFPLELGEHDVYTFRVVSAERLRRFKDRHGASEAPKALRQLKTRRPGADDDEMLRPFCEIENAFAGEIRAGVEARNFRQRRFGSSRYHEAARTDLDIAGSDCVAVLELRLRVDNATAESGKTLR